MAAEFLNEQLALYLGKPIMVATSTTVVDGVLQRIRTDAVEIAQDASAYESISQVSIIPIDSINYVRVTTLTP
ncbi:hypothetical protein [Fictibacillus fluitans]|uniref:DUF2642 domain-containing protein n=1 Tax=Fictibacillus fluitans TaxID=3058422 RepID=A0ABT8HQJ8_9BACL|nr:hypothetical protein [Fictibacillus sp. NE201]MDN4523029.1 hypothetical protein [Fictibacillus sp. NE201]